MVLLGYIFRESQVLTSIFRVCGAFFVQTGTILLFQSLILSGFINVLKGKSLFFSPVFASPPSQSAEKSAVQIVCSSLHPPLASQKAQFGAVAVGRGEAAKANGSPLIVVC